VTFRLLLVVGLILTLTSPSRAVEINGSLGGGYGRTDAWSPATHSDLNEFDWEASLAASGSFFRPGMLQWLIGGEYRGARTLYFKSTSALDGLAYHGQLSLLTSTVVPVTFKLGRSWTQFSDNEKAGFGSTLVTTEGGTAALRFAQLPTLRFGVTRTDVENHSFGAGLSKSDTTALDVSASQSLANFQYQLAYDTSWNGGTYDETNYHSHAIDAEASSALNDQVRFHFFDRYYLRDPTRDAATNPRYDDNALGTGVQWRPSSRTTVSFEYGFRHVQVEVAGTPNSEQLEHSLSNSTYRRLTPELSLLGNAAVAYSLERVGPRSLGTVTESAGAGLTWKREIWKWLSLDLSVGGTAGAAERSAQPAAFLWGATWNGGTTARWTSARAGLYYSGSYQSSASAGGEAIDQRLVAQGEGIAGRAYLNGQVNLNQTQREDPLLGLFRSRAATASFGATVTRFSSKLSAGLAEGLSDPLRSPDIHSGLLLPASFNTKTRFANLTISTGADKGRLQITGVARTMALETPGRPLQYEHGLGLTATYTIGAFQISLEDQFSVGGAGPVWERGNRVMLRVVRNLGFNL
jgi:hypothetical protein